MEIEINNPIELKMSVLESEDRLPSIKLLVEIVIKHLTGTSCYNANDIWVDCTHWDKFTNKLNILGDNTQEIALLNSLSEGFQIKIISTPEGYKFELFCKEPDMGSGLFELRYSKNIDEDELGAIKQRFDNFPRWW
ncbi:hypothetical protein Q4E93_26425 [Flavitalea sp. BT771]|uniref:hypothetical protein n=1 Tax=Flavitalea sp. BT771 TaxID=3063329 RepID=UPI0026E1CE2F|nr:hypothetical protein [Flavitalea sp. BT771]MDO6434173.1 hypothetical protein [Flavitalea sp. BT771]MDV6223073.1 hypothetical protein [Flavitalea sp. BT771]